MSRWHLSSAEDIAHGSAKACERAGLRSSGQITDSNCHGQAYFKRAIDSLNFVRFGEEDWICSAGTLIYGGQPGPDSLGRLYRDFIEGGIATIREKTIGHYALAIRHGHSLVILTDSQGALNLYYINRGGYWFVSNSLSLCAQALPERKVDAAKLLVTIFQTSTPGEDTFYPGIKRLFGTQQIHIDLQSQAFEVKTIPAPAPATSWRLLSMDAAIAQYVAEVRRVFEKIASVRPIALLGTGGLDSRTILAALLDQKVAPHLMCARGNNCLTDSDPRDIEIAESIAQQCQLSFQQLDWSGHQPHSIPALQHLFEVYGFSYEIYGAPEGFLHSFDGGISPYPKLFLGGYAPAFTNSKPWDLKQKSFSFADLVDDAMRSVGTMNFLNFKPAYRSVFAREVRVGLRCAGIDFPEEGAPLETFVKAKLFLYTRAEARMLNLLNEFGHYIAPFLMKELHDPLVSVPLEIRKKDEFQIRLIQALAPDLMAIPLCSGWQRASIDPLTFRLIRAAGGQKKPLLRRVAHQLLPAGLRVHARKLYARMRRLKPQEHLQSVDRDHAIGVAYSQQIMDDSHARRWFASTAELTPKLLARIHQYLVGVNKLGYSEWIDFVDFS
jgi:hypothetical protein